MKVSATRILALLIVTAVANASAVADHLGFDPVREPERAATAYVAPENMLIQRLRQPDGSVREFEYDYSRPGFLRSRFGWSGKTTREGLRLASGPGAKHGSLTYAFKGGRIASLTVNGKRTDFDPSAKPPVLPADRSPMLASGAEPVESAEVKREMSSKWKRSGRLQFPWNNPNCNALLYAELMIAAVALLLVARTRKLQVLCSAVAGVFAVLLLMAGSRGALLGAVVALAVCAFAVRGRLRVLLSRRGAKLAVLAGIVILAVAAFVLSPRLLTRGFGEGNRGWSNKLRVEIWHNAPRMMVDAPGGWGSDNQAVGLSYMDWYQPLEVVCLTGSLINDHLTTLVSRGWAGRIGYLFFWFAMLALGAVVLLRRHSPFMLAIWSLFAVAAWFNPVFVERPLWILPAMAIIPLLRSRPWRDLRPNLTALSVAGALAVAVASGLYLYGSSVTVTDSVQVVREGRRTVVNGTNPKVWAVDDLGEPFGGVLACKGIRAHYLANPQNAALGYVRDIADLPTHVGRLVLGGRSGDAWLKAVCSDPKMRANLPLEVIFVSPPFPPSAVPPVLRETCRVFYVTGEFVTWYHPDEFSGRQDWIKVIPGAELYIPGWVEMVTAGVQ